MENNGTPRFLFVGEGETRKTIPMTILFGILVMLVIVLIGCLSLTFQKEYSVNYTEKSNLDYKVYLKPNDYFQKEFLPKNMNYVSTLINYLDADFDYEFESDDKLDLEYNYYVKATVLVNNEKGKNIYTKEEILVDNRQFKNAEKNHFKINQNVRIDYVRYNQLISNFVSRYDIAANSKVVVGLYVDVVGKHSDFDKKLQDKAVINLEIPLTNKQLDIEMNYELSNNKNEVFQYKATLVKNPILFGLSIILAVLDVLTIIGLIVYIIINRDNVTLYKSKLKRILRDYRGYICETNNFKRTEIDEDLRVEYVKSFDDIINIRDSVEKPILFHEERKNERAIFYLIDGNVAYIYVMRAVDMKKEKEKYKVF